MDVLGCVLLRELVLVFSNFLIVVELLGLCVMVFVVWSSLVSLSMWGIFVLGC